MNINGVLNRVFNAVYPWRSLLDSQSTHILSTLVGEIDDFSWFRHLLLSISIDWCVYFPQSEPWLRFNKTWVQWPVRRPMRRWRLEIPPTINKSLMKRHVSLFKDTLPWSVSGDRMGSTGYKIRRISSLFHCYRRICTSLTGAFSPYSWSPTSWPPRFSSVTIPL